MTNKYQDSLNKIKSLKIKPNDDPYKICQLVESIDDMQELIDDYDYMKTDVELAKQEIELLNKALDKACSKLSELTEKANIPELNVHSVIYSKDAWKEWLLNDK